MNKSCPMTLQENLFIAKKLLSELIYNSAYIEGCNVTFPQTETILNGMVTNGVSVSDIQTVINLRDGWRYILNEAPIAALDLPFINKVNEHVSRNESLLWGSLRTGKVAIGGTSYLPPIPQEEEVQAYLQQINCIDDPTERAVTYFISATKKQLYFDGNKRTSILVANALLISSGRGVLTINEQNAQRYNELLHALYNSAEDGRDLTEPVSREFAGFLKEEINRITKKFEFAPATEPERSPTIEYEKDDFSL